ncbi:Metallo-dependent phosphatase-like protein [Cantharellus anzutake]|uniref:Metallo-dependent phosphatase-like protein n=1 Tax=Cantharellus anzutake TaxID=1750568 RepID=UPI001904D84B|nr:Metallo-dependent phosphatase-like protein [Cantharellus anzutake]KAF8328352.1 Metallo-dependent phosphatase-like protein [Cantharellus anzutake]
MVLVLLIGDLHIPYRTHDLPAKFKKLLLPGKIQQIICTGNICDKETYDYLRTIASEVHVVRGDYDEDPRFPLSLALSHPPLRIGAIHGHLNVPVGELDSLGAIARQMDVDVLVHGHTHKFETMEHQGRFFVNPGSATGAWMGKSMETLIPSFALMDVQGPVVVTYVYRLIDNEVKVEKIEWRKPTPVERQQVVNGYSAQDSTRSPGPSAPRDIPPSTSAWA